eukprot:TRINITY_DN62998_c0_g1_i1.p1 TRINITY_DN62998_c0_g1~~TRINITY_DN62998_c0_g1_i1.p1  ORF type:complete len:376 (-),score=50.60 TRINITY_DN62998_c0_g1_i1:54-1181(-)
MPPCGRAACTLAPQTFIKKASKTQPKKVDEWRGEDQYTPSFNIAPGSPLPVLYFEYNEEGEHYPVLHTMRWGLIPSFGPIQGTNLSNARSETLRDKPFFNKLLSGRRCVVLVDGFYEWQRNQPTKKTYFVRAEKPTKEDATDSEQCELLRMAGLFDVWQNRETHEIVHSFTIITTDSNKSFTPIHHRQPAVLQTQEDLTKWLDVRNYSFESVKELLDPCQNLHWYRVSPDVGNVKNNGPQLMKKFDQTSGIGKFFTTPKKEEPKEVKVEEEGGFWSDGTSSQEGEKKPAVVGPPSVVAPSVSSSSSSSSSSGEVKKEQPVTPRVKPETGASTVSPNRQKGSPSPPPKAKKRAPGALEGQKLSKQQKTLTDMFSKK